MSGSVRGVPGNGHPYRNRADLFSGARAQHSAGPLVPGVDRSFKPAVREFEGVGGLSTNRGHFPIAAFGQRPAGIPSIIGEGFKFLGFGAISSWIGWDQGSFPLSAYGCCCNAGRICAPSSREQEERLCHGNSIVRLDGEKVAELGDGQFIGQIAYITNEKAPVSIVAKGSMRIISWSRVKLDTFFKDRPDVELQLDHSLGADLTRLLGNDRVAQNANPVDLDLSPGFIQRGGFCTKATPSGLPVEITSPALSGVHHSHENHREFF